MLKHRLIMLCLLLTCLFPVVASGQAIEESGKGLYDLKCGRCHIAYAPEKYSLEEWKTVMQDMGSMSGLDTDSERAILDYLEQNAADGKTRTIPTSPVLAGYLYTEFISSQDSVDTFDIHYLNINLTGRLHERVSYRAEFELEHGGGESDPPFIEQAYLDVWLNKNMALRIGAMLTPFNRFDAFHAPLENLLVTRPQMSREIGVSAWKEVGIDLHGHVFLNKDLYLNYDLYVINGLGSGGRLRNSRQYRDNNDAKSMGFRLSGVVADRWEAGVSYYHGAWDDEGDYALDQFGLHLLARIEGFKLHAEYASSRSENPVPLAKGEADGYFVQASYLIEGKFRPTVRYGSLDYLDRANMLGRSPTDYDRNVLALGFNYYMTDWIVFKIEYDFYREGDRKQDVNNDLLALQAAIRF